MEHAQLQKVKSEYVKLSQYFGRPLSDTALVAYAEDLEDLRFDSVMSAMRTLRTQPGRRSLPLPGDIREACTTTLNGDLMSQSYDIAGKIVDAIRRFGYTNPAAARGHIGPVGWSVTERMGGWQHICNTLTADRIGTFTAQCRDMAKSLLVMGALPEPPRPLLDAPDPKGHNGLLSLGTLLQGAMARG